MPAALGDANKSFLTLTKTQYFLLQQWILVKARQQPKTLSAGEKLDKAVLVNCLGGRFSPGIDLTFIVRQPDLYIKDWQTSGTGPFRVKPKPLDYSTVQRHTPLLTEGYVPLHTGNTGLEPGDISKFMAIPWHTDYNSCATHLPSPNPSGNNYLFWSWPAQRPVAVYVAKDIKDNGYQLTKEDGSQLQQWSVRGKNTGTKESRAQDWGRYQNYHVVDMLTNWPKIGIVMNAQSIDTLEDGTAFDSSKLDNPSTTYLEAQSLLTAEPDGTPVVPFPNIQDQKPPSS